MSSHALVARGLTKRFGGVVALDGAGIEVRRGEVHALLGANGSGKSTLIKILAGYHAPEPGAELEVHGRPVALPLRAEQPRALGLSFVHQDLALIPSLSVLENLRLGELAVRRGARISWRDEHRRARELFDRYGVRFDTRAAAGSLPALDRALLAIVRALQGAAEPVAAGEGAVLVLDEPTVFLPRGETEQLFRLVRDVAARGGGVLLVSHDLAEVRRVADRVTVLRDGRSVGTVAVADVDEQELVEMILARRVERLRAQPAREAAGAFLALGGASGSIVRDLTLHAAAGEVVGLTGLAGSGYDEVPHLVFGAAPARGTIELGGARHDLAAMRPDLALAAGMALVPADRQRDGMVESLGVGDNVSLPVLARFGRGLRLRRGQLVRAAAALLERFGVRPADPRLAARALSGGNQQKALLAKWLQTEPRLLLLDEPTHGVDVGARAEILELVRSAAAGGACVLYASADHDELASVSDRVLVFSGGRVAHEASGPELAAERLLELCLSDDAGARALTAP